MSQPLENIIKQGYLKKGNTGGNRLSGLLRKIEGQKWFVFTIRQGVPYLEYYDNDTEVFTQRPVNCYRLSQCHSVTSMGRTNPPTFTIACADRFIELIASSRSQMLEWAHDIETTLTRLGILKTEKCEHIYTALPAVVRQPRVSQDVVAERETQAEGTNQSSSSHQQSNVQRPPLPERPTNLVSQASLRHTPSDANSDLELLRHRPSDANSDLELGASSENAETSHCSNDSDFVSWDVVMKVRESFLLKFEEDKAKLSEDIEEGECLGATALVNPQDSVESSDFSTSVLNASLLYAKPKPKHNLAQIDDTLDLTMLPKNDCSEFCGLEYESDLSADVEHINRKSQVEENEYSLLPAVLERSNASQVDADTDVQTKVKPIPLPRRALSLRANSQEKQDLNNSISSHTRNASDASGASMHLNSLEEDSESRQKSVLWSSSQNSGDYFGEENEMLNGIDMDLNNFDKTLHTKDENANFYDIKNSTPHCVLAPPSIPPRCDSLSGWTGTTTSSSNTSFLPQSDPDCTNYPNVYSHPLSSSAVQAFMPPPSSPHASKVMSIPPPLHTLSSHKKEDISSNNPQTRAQQLQQQESTPPAIPPLPLPRRKTTKATTTTSSSSQGAFYSTRTTDPDIPPQLPRRRLPKSVSLPEDPPPQLPSRNSKSKLMSSFSFAESSEKAKLLNDQASMASGSSIRDRDRKASTLAATPGSRQSRLAKKMLLDRANSMHTVVSLKQTQAEILQTEIDKTHVSMTLTQKSGHGLALVDWNGMPCIAGWNQKDFPSLHGRLHIGDMLISVNHVRVTSPDTAQKLLRHATEPKIEVMLQRMPYAKVFAIRRSAEGQSLGLKREGGTGEILYVDPNGLAAYHGLPQYATGTLGKPRCTWFLTEINSRPLNLFFKENEIEHLLYAVGREISIVVQPSDFIFEIRRALKKLKNHKNFITQ